LPRLIFILPRTNPHPPYYDKQKTQQNTTSTTTRKKYNNKNKPFIYLLLLRNNGNTKQKKNRQICNTLIQTKKQQKSHISNKKRLNELKHENYLKFVFDFSGILEKLLEIFEF